MGDVIPYRTSAGIGIVVDYVFCNIFKIANKLSVCIHIYRNRRSGIVGF